MTENFGYQTDSLPPVCAEGVRPLSPEPFQCLTHLVVSAGSIIAFAPRSLFHDVAIFVEDDLEANTRLLHKTPNKWRNFVFLSRSTETVALQSSPQRLGHLPADSAPTVGYPRELPAGLRLPRRVLRRCHVAPSRDNDHRDFPPHGRCLDDHAWINPQRVHRSHDQGKWRKSTVDVFCRASRCEPQIRAC